MNDVFFLSECIEIPTASIDESVPDPRRSHEFCLRSHEKKKLFFTSESAPHEPQCWGSEAQAPEFTPVHSNLHNYEMITNPRDTPFFSLHGPHYETIAHYFDPRRTKDRDILGDLLYPKQIFISPGEEINASNGIEFESLTDIYESPQIVDLPLLDMEVDKFEDLELDISEGELTKTRQNISVESVPGSECDDGRDEDFDDYRDLLIDLMVTKQPSETRKTILESRFIKQTLLSGNEGADSGTLSNTTADEPPNSFVDEISVVGEKPADTPPTKPNLTARLLGLSRLTTDPDNSFIEHVDRVAASTPILGRPSKRKTLRSPNMELEFQSRKRQKSGDSAGSGSSLDVKSISSETTSEPVSPPTNETTFLSGRTVTKAETRRCLDLIAPLNKTVQGSPKEIKVRPDLHTTFTGPVRIKDVRSCSLLDAGLSSIRQLKAPETPSQCSDKSPLLVTVNENTLMKEPDSTAHSVESTTLQKLSVRDRPMAEQLGRFCDCWQETEKHSHCVEHYGEFLVVMSTRYSQQLDISTINSALGVLSRHDLTSTGVLLRAALFTTELLRVVTHDNQGF